MRAWLALLFVFTPAFFFFQNCGRFDTLPISGNFSSTQSSSGTPALSLEQRAYDVLNTNCAQCHGDNSIGAGGVSHILSVKALVAAGTIVPGSSASSPLYLLASQNKMPFNGSLDDDSIQALKDWIDAGAKDLSPGPTVMPLAALPNNDAALKVIADDLAAQVPGDQANLRYFTFTHLPNSGIVDHAYRLFPEALNKMVNSLSWEHLIQKPKALDTFSFRLPVNP